MWVGIAVIGLAAVLLLGVATRFIPQPVTVWPWQALLIYRGGRCRRVLGPGRHWAARDGLNELVHVTVAEQAGQLGPVDAVAREGFGVRLTLGYAWTVADPVAYHEASLGRSAYTSGVALPGFDSAFGAAVTAATPGIALAELLTNPQPVAAAVLDALADRWPSVTLTGVTVVKVTAPPEVRRLLTEVEAARLQGLAALERARGEQAALRSLANAARLVRDNPELAQLRLLQVIETAKRPATIVLGSAALGVGGEGVAALPSGLPSARLGCNASAVLDLAHPFVLLDDARAGGAGARLYRRAVEVVAAGAVGEVWPALERVRAGVAQGLCAAGFLAYEAGPAFELSLKPRSCPTPLLWFGLFEGWEAVDAAALLPDPAGVYVSAPKPAIDRVEYDRRFGEVLQLIAAGDLYQANLTFPAAVPFVGDPLSLYAAVRARAAAGWGGIVWTGRELILSFSPELFFALDGRAITCRPMKGTARRGDAPAADEAAARALAGDAKSQAENLMIVDLLRNDLSRVAAPGSVDVPALFTVERYPTVLQMTSTVTARLAEGRDAVDVLAAAFPCGSITGAPKLRATEALAGIEGAPRGVYTGSIGRIDGGGSAQFNVAIRTLTVRDGPEGYLATMGLGGGIVADSRADDEWDEALAKGAFLTAGQRPVDLIETMAFDPFDGLLRLDRHLARMKESAAALGFRFDRHGARNELQAATFRLREARRVRLLLARSGAIAIEVGPMPAAIARMEVAAVPLPVRPGDYRLRHKTSDRGFYDDARARAGTAEVVFEDVDGFLTEGSYTSLFVERGGVLLTPPLARGLLPGVLRGALIDEGRAVERELTRADLADGFLVGNALRGLVPAHLAVANGTAPPL